MKTGGVVMGCVLQPCALGREEGHVNRARRDEVGKLLRDQRKGGCVSEREVGRMEGQGAGTSSLRRALNTSLVLSGDRSGANGRVSEALAKCQARPCGTEVLIPGNPGACLKRWLWKFCFSN